MLTLYVKTGCPYCAKVLASFASNDITYETKNINDSGVPEELIAKGGKQQVPFMVDGETMMYESDDIIAYTLKNKSEEIPS